MNSGIITSMFSLNCVISALMSYVLFDERLTAKFILGIVLSLACVVLIAMPDNPGQFKPHEFLKNMKWHSDFSTALMYGMLTPVLLSSLLNLTRFLTIKHNYNSMDLSLDMFFLCGLVEVPAFIHYH